jgi:hypothetical protein
MPTVGCEEKARLMQERGVVELRKPEIPLPCNSESERVQFPIYRVVGKVQQRSDSAKSLVRHTDFTSPKSQGEKDPDLWKRWC